MDRTDRNRLVKLVMLAAPLLSLFTACTQREEPPITVAALPEVVVTASRLDPDEAPDDEEPRVVARTDR